jgi:hypothetical protein
MPKRVPAVGLERRLVERAVALGVAIGLIAFMFTRSFNLTDGDAYWNAAMRLRDGLPLYPLIENQDLPTTYRYAPWLAWLWVPVTYLPHFAALAVARVPVRLRGAGLHPGHEAR